MSRTAVWVVVAGGLWACADGAVGDDNVLRPPPAQDMRATPDPPLADARPTRDAQRLDLGSAPDATLEAGPVDAAPLSDRAELPNDAAPDGPRLADASADGPALDGAPADAGPSPDGPPPPADAAPPEADGAAPCPEETCNGVDDDCDGAIDEGPGCGPWVQAHCVLYAGWSDRDRNPGGVAPAWGPCPPADRAFADRDLHCVGTRRDGRFARLNLGGDVNEDDALGVALRCADDEAPALAEYVQSHCAFFLGWADSNRGSDGAVVWGACPDQLVSNVGVQRCTSTGYDGNFRALDLDGDVDENDDLGAAWVCRDAADPARAAALQSHVAVYVGWADNNRAPPDTSGVWGVCPNQPAGQAASQRCQSTHGDGRFHRLDLDGDVDENDALGFSVRAR